MRQDELVAILDRTLVDGAAVVDECLESEFTKFSIKLTQLKQDIEAHQRLVSDDDDDVSYLEAKRKQTKAIYKLSRLRSESGFSARIIPLMATNFNITDQQAHDVGSQMATRGAGSFSQRDRIYLGRIALIEKFFKDAKKIIFAKDKSDHAYGGKNGKCVVQ